MGPPAAADAAAESKNAAMSIATDRLIYATRNVLVILALIIPWPLEISGLGDLSPIEGSSAAAWQGEYAGHALSPPQKLFGMVSWKTNYQRPFSNASIVLGWGGGFCLIKRLCEEGESF